MLNRRLLLAALLGAAHAPVLARQASHIAASWQDDQGQAWLGLLQPQQGSLQVQAKQALPDRAHGIVWAPDGSVLTTARRPGDWLLRWWPSTGRTQWRWSEPGQHFNGHLLRRHDGHWLSTETDLANGEGLLALRDRNTLEKLESWPSGGRDPHALLADGDHHVLIANGGLLLEAASGRRVLSGGPPTSNLSRVAIGSGEQKSWRLEDPWLSIRHLARSANGRVGIALQAQHAQVQTRARAPLLALWDGQALLTAPDSALAGDGYAADICAAPGGGFWLSAPASGLLVFGDDGRVKRLDLVGAGPLSANGWAGGRQHARRPTRSWALPAGLRLDNHWL